MRTFIKHALFCAALMGTAWSAQANTLPYQSVQTENNEKKELPNPEKAARRMTDEMQKSLGLTDKQYKKVYKLNLKEEKARVEQMTSKGADGNRPPMMGGAPSGGFPPIGGGPGGGGFPPMGGNGGPGMPPPSSSGKNDMRSLMEKKDKQRSTYYNYYTNKTWGMASSYNLSIDASILGVEETVNFILRFIAEFQNAKRKTL